MASGSIQSILARAPPISIWRFVPERVAVELDGAAFHDGRINRERDMRRDAALSALGWVVLRFSYWRLHDEPDVVRDEIAAVLVTRRSQLAA